MKSPVLIGVVTVAIGTASAAAATLEISPGVTNEINVTTDSSPGWTPTIEQRQRALKAFETFLDDVEAGRYREAYERQTEINRRNQTVAQFTQDAEKFKAQAGAAKFWRVLKVTWTKDSARTPIPGIYAAIDHVAQFANVDRYCGYMVLYQPSTGGDFTIMRREGNYIDNPTARNIEAQKSKTELAKMWGQLARHCPNYAFPPDAR